MGSVWVLVNVYQQDLAYVSVGDPVSVETDAYSKCFTDAFLRGAVSLDPTTRTLSARIVTDNSTREAEERYVRDCRRS